MQIKIFIPEEYAESARVPVIKAIRGLTNEGLFIAKQISDTPGEVIINVYGLEQGSSTKSTMEQYLKDLVMHGVKVNYYGILLDSLRKASADALNMCEDDIADNILQHILALKLKHGI